jgi:NADH-quinone oxidoreductase subunit N
MTYIYLFSEIYLFISFFILFVVSIFLNLSRQNNFPNIYRFTCFLIIVFCINLIVIDIWNYFENFNSYDIYKNSADLIIKWIIIFFTVLFFIYSYFYIEKMKLHFFEYSLTIYFILLSFSFFILTIDFLSFYLLLEIQSFCFYLLTAFNKYNQYSVESGLKYFILSSFSSVSLLFGYSFIYGMVGTFNFLDVFLFFSNIDSIDNNFLYSYAVASLLILVAFLFKLYIAPFHLWVSDIYQGAPTMTTAYFATITSFPLFYVLIKFFINFFYWIQPYFMFLFLILSILSMLLGLFGALYQKKIKRLIAFSSVSNIGYLLIGFIQESPQSLSYSVTYFLLYMLNIAGIFLVFLNLYFFKYHFFLERLVFLSGLINRNRWLAFSLIVLFFTSAGIPPFSLFLAKILILTGLSYNFYSILLFILVFSAIVSGFYYLRVVKYMSFNTLGNWNYLLGINYVNCLLILYIVLFSSFFWWNGSKLLLLSDFILLSIF